MHYWCFVEFTGFIYLSWNFAGTSQDHGCIFLQKWFLKILGSAFFPHFFPRWFPNDWKLRNTKHFIVFTSPLCVPVAHVLVILFPLCDVYWLHIVIRVMWRILIETLSKIRLKTDLPGSHHYYFLTWYCSFWVWCMVISLLLVFCSPCFLCQYHCLHLTSYFCM